MFCVVIFTGYSYICKTTLNRFAMKHCLLFSALLFLPYLAICQTNEQKASNLVKEYLSGVLDDADSYEPAGIKVEALFNTPTFDRDCLDAGKLMTAEEELEKEYRQKALKAEEEMNKWMMDMSSQGLAAYDKAALLHYENKISEVKAAIRYWEQAKFIKEQSKLLNGKKQVGWTIVHNFRSKDKTGVSALYSYTFLADNDFQSITGVYNNEEAKTRKAILNIDAILKADDTPADYDKMIEGLKGTIKTYTDLKAQIK